MDDGRPAELWPDYSARNIVVVDSVPLASPLAKWLLAELPARALQRSRCSPFTPWARSVLADMPISGMFAAIVDIWHVAIELTRARLSPRCTPRGSMRLDMRLRGLEAWKTGRAGGVPRRWRETISPLAKYSWCRLPDRPQTGCSRLLASFPGGVCTPRESQRDKNTRIASIAWAIMQWILKYRRHIPP